MIASANRRGRMGRCAKAALRIVGGLLAGLAWCSPAPASTLRGSPTDSTPTAWLVYAAQASRALAEWLSRDDPVALRLRRYLERTRPAPDQPPPPVQVSLWVASDGTLTRIEAPLFTEPQATADLRSLLLNHRLPGAPPADMLQPMRLLLRLEPAPPAVRPAIAAPGEAGSHAGK